MLYIALLRMDTLPQDICPFSISTEVFNRRLLGSMENSSHISLSMPIVSLGER